ERRASVDAADAEMLAAEVLDQQLALRRLVLNHHDVGRVGHPDSPVPTTAYARVPFGLNRGRHHSRHAAAAAWSLGASVAACITGQARPENVVFRHWTY